MWGLIMFFEFFFFFFVFARIWNSCFNKVPAEKHDSYCNNINNHVQSRSYTISFNKQTNKQTNILFVCLMNKNNVALCGVFKTPHTTMLESKSHWMQEMEQKPKKRYTKQQMNGVSLQSGFEV